MYEKKYKIYFNRIFLLTMITGCGSKNENKGSKNSLISFNDASVLNKYEAKTIDTNVTYKELTYKTKDNSLHLDIIVYNERDEAIEIWGNVQGYKGNTKTSQVSQGDAETIPAHSAYVLRFLLMNADNYKIRTLSIENSNYEKSIFKSDYTFNSYKIEKDTQWYNSAYTEVPTLKLLVKYNGNEENSSEIQILGFKDDELVCSQSSYINYSEKNYEPNFDKEITKKGDLGITNYFCGDAYQKGIAVNDMTQFIYFVHGRNER